MLLPPRTYRLSQIPDRGTTHPVSPFLDWTPAWNDSPAAERSARKMLLVHQAGSVKVGEVVRYTLTYTPSADRILPSPSHLHLKIKNTSAIPLRAAYLHGPYTLHVAAYPSTFNPNRKVENPKKEGIPDFEPFLKAGGSWTTQLLIPEDIRESGGKASVSPNSDGQPEIVTWIIEVHSQILFSNSACVHFEVLVGRDERSLEYGFAAAAAQGQSAPGQVEDHQQGKNGHEGRHRAQHKGVYSKSVKLVVEDTEALWNKPALPEWEEDEGDAGENEAEVPKRAKTKKQKKLHLVILTHGLHSNLGADMLYLKESIDAAAAQAREERRKERRAARKAASKAASSETTTNTNTTQSDNGEAGDYSTAPLSGGQADIDEGEIEDDDSDDEEVVVRGYPGNAVRTERGIQFLGKRLAKYVLGLAHPEPPYFPVKKGLKKAMSDSIQKKDKSPVTDGIPVHAGSSVHYQPDAAIKKKAYRYTSISFIGHSLGGLIQTYAIAYIHKHSPEFFSKIKPVNFITMASPLLGLSNENPMYVKFALDFGLIGRTGQDLGLTWRAPTLARGGWAAMVNGLGGASQKEQKKPQDPRTKPLLRILPSGPAHQVLRMFRNRTVYGNVVNDGIVPLRTSCLLFLDWKGLGKVEKARRENGLVGTLANWGYAELTGQNSSPMPSKLALPEGEDNNGNSGTSTPLSGSTEHTVPQPGENAVNEDTTAQTSSEPQVTQFLSDSQRQAVQAATGAKKSPKSPTNVNFLTDFFNYLKGATTTPKDKKMFKRSQTLQASSNEEPPADTSDSLGQTNHSRESSMVDDHDHPPKTSFFESAGDLLNPPIPPVSWIIDPSVRARTIFHDRVYHPEDIPPPPIRRPSKVTRTGSSDQSVKSVSTTETVDSSSMRVEEKIARSYHKDLSWRKVLVRLEPDAHNNIIVRRMFANAYGWPVVKHLCDTHFADTYTAHTRDERESNRDRAQGVKPGVTAKGEEVKDQSSKDQPAVSPTELREAADELAPLRPLPVRTGSDSGTGSGTSSANGSPPRTETQAEAQQRIRREVSTVWDDSYFEGTEDDTDEDDSLSSGNEGTNNRWSLQRFLAPAPKGKNSASGTAGDAAKPSAHAPKSSSGSIDLNKKLPPTPAALAQAEALGLNYSYEDSSASSSPLASPRFPRPVEYHRGLGPTSVPAEDWEPSKPSKGETHAPEADPTDSPPRVPAKNDDSTHSSPSKSVGPGTTGTESVGLRNSLDVPVGDSNSAGVVEEVARLSLGDASAMNGESSSTASTGEVKSSKV
ncbi:putative serine esterase-domain-containing protein [Phyllosticta citribraziliensis]|uniref:Serine esterase-domain-containing protein n=1 Tax=Phyllosticta citribraziliensis TaxID=989973 RepID=A0ABR1L7J9_9PEZI